MTNQYRIAFLRIELTIGLVGDINMIELAT